MIFQEIRASIAMIPHIFVIFHMAKSYLLAELRGLSVDADRLTELGSKTGYRTLTSLEMSSDLLIHHASS